MRYGAALRSNPAADAIEREIDMTSSRPTALVTGASSGLGVEFACQLAEDGYDLVLVAPGDNTLQRFAREIVTNHGVLAIPVAIDLSGSAAADELWEEVESTGRRIDVLINNAGIGISGPFARSDARATQGMLELNISALTTLTRRALPGMFELGSGRILNVSSVAGYQAGGPGMAAYYASKSYVLSFTRALARELRGTGVTATALCPAPTRTRFWATAGAQHTGLLRWIPQMHAAAVAASGLRAMRAGRACVVPGLLNKVTTFLDRGA
jgi:uncharacterized protein